MDESNKKQKQWSVNVKWAKCREPYKTELDGVATLWIEGQISNEELALELWMMWSKKRFAETVTKSPAIDPKMNGPVQEQIEILVEAMRMALQMESATPDERHQLLELSRSHGGRREELQR